MLEKFDLEYVDRMTAAYRALADVTWMSHQDAFWVLQAIRSLEPGESYTIRRVEDR